MTQKWEVFGREISHIENEELREFVKLALEKAPPYFWKYPASKSGKFHPEDDLGEGGLVHHTKKVVYFVRSLAEAMEVEKFNDELIIAALLHDVVKYGLNPSSKTAGYDYAIHGPAVKKFIEEEVLENKIEGVYNGEMLRRITKILDLISRHMGKWSVQDYRPRKRGDWALHLADYISSRKRVVIERGTL